MATFLCAFSAGHTSHTSPPNGAAELAIPKCNGPLRSSDHPSVGETRQCRSRSISAHQADPIVVSPSPRSKRPLRRELASLGMDFSECQPPQYNTIGVRSRGDTRDERVLSAMPQLGGDSGS